MGKNTDKLYITHIEWSGAAGQHSAARGIASQKLAPVLRQLPFTHCALRLTPFEHPVAKVDVIERTGVLFDVKNIVHYIKKHGTDPTSGDPMNVAELYPVHFQVNEAREYVDPVTYKAFTDSTHIIFIRTSGNVYAYDTIEKLNIKPQIWKDLVSEDGFSRADIITIQNPFRARIAYGNRIGLQSGDSNVSIKVQNKTAQYKAKTLSKAADEPKKPVPPQAVAPYSTGRAAASLTSTCLSPITSNTRATLSFEDYILRPKKVPYKGFAKIISSLGDMTVELVAEYAPKAVYNFIMLSKDGKYDDTIFHRNVPRFMVQGGDPTGTGRGGESFWGKDFEDELNTNLRHDDRGIMSMANSGRNTNNSQFFITYRPAPELDRKHTIFGRLIDGFGTLDRIEKSEVKSIDTPVTPIRILNISVHVDPFERLEEERRKGFAEQLDIHTNQRTHADEHHSWTGKPIYPEKCGSAPSTDLVGIYLQDPTLRQGIIEKRRLSLHHPGPSSKKVRPGFGDFEGF